MIQEHKIHVQKTAHYYTFGTPTEKVEYFWLATHGYGELAGRTIKKFDIFDANKHFVVAPEALNKFYWKRPQPGATWMTSHQRLDEIADYTKYIKGLYDHYLAQLHPNVKIILFGFSQGSQTQMRWIMNELPHFDHLILWAGALPDDLDYTQQKEYFASKKLHWIYGDKDEFLTPEYLKMHKAFAKKNQLDLNIHEFKGTHRIEKDVLKNVFNSFIMQE